MITETGPFSTYSYLDPTLTDIDIYQITAQMFVYKISNIVKSKDILIIKQCLNHFF